MRKQKSSWTGRHLWSLALSVACCLLLVGCGDSNSGGNNATESFQFLSLDPAAQNNAGAGLNGPVGPVGPGTGQPVPIVPGATGGTPSPIFAILTGQGDNQREPDVSVNPSGFLAVTATSLSATGPYVGRRVMGERFSILNFSAAPTSLGVDGVSDTDPYHRDVIFPKVATTLASQYVAVWANGLASGPYATSVRGQGVAANGAFAGAGPYGPVDFVLEGGGAYGANVLGPYGVRTGPSIALATTTNELAMTALKLVANPISSPYAVITKLNPTFGLLAGFPKTGVTADSFSLFDGATVAVSNDGTRIVGVGIRTNGQIAATILDGNGNTITAPFLVNAVTFASTRPSVAMFANGSFVVVFGANDGNVYARTFDNVGTPQVAQEVNLGQGFNPDVAAEQNNLRFAVAWSLNDMIFFQRFTAPNATAVGTAQDVSTGSPFGAQHALPSVTVNPDGDAVVVFQSTDGVNTRVHGRAYPRP